MMRAGLVAALCLLAAPAVAQQTSTIPYPITVTNNDPQITAPSTTGSYVSCTAPAGEHVARVTYSGTSGLPGFSTGDATGSFVITPEYDGIWLEVGPNGVAPSLCGTGFTLSLTAMTCPANLALDWTQPCDAVSVLLF